MRGGNDEGSGVEVQGTGGKDRVSTSTGSVQGSSGFRVPGGIWAICFSGILTGLCYLAAGGTLGMVVGSLVVMTVLGPLLGMVERGGLRRLRIYDGVLGGVLLVLLGVSMRAGWGFGNWNWISLVIWAYG